MTPTFEQLRVAIFDWLHQSLNSQSFDLAGVPTVLPEGDENAVPVLRSEDDAIRPERLFVEFKLLTGLRKVGAIDELQYRATGDKFVSKGQREITVSINIVGEGAQECMAKIQNSLNLSYNQQLLRAAGLSVRQDEAVADTSVFQETNYEERAVFDVIFGVAVETDDPVSRIEDVELESNLAGGQTIIVSSP